MTNSNSTRGFFGRVGKMFMDVAETQSRVNAVRRLNDMSDAQLNKAGIEREDIVRHVFRDRFFL